MYQAKEAASAALSQASSAFGFLKNSVAGTAIGSSLLSKGVSMCVYGARVCLDACLLALPACTSA